MFYGLELCEWLLGGILEFWGGGSVDLRGRGDVVSFGEGVHEGVD